MNSMLADLFEKTKLKAKKILSDRPKLKKLMNDVVNRITKVDKHGKSPHFKELFTYLRTFVRAIKKQLAGEYKLPPDTLVLMVASLIYFLSPIDLIPDFIPVLGFLDDLAVILWIGAEIKKDLDDFLAWEASQSDDVVHLK